MCGGKKRKLRFIYKLKQKEMQIFSIFYHVSSRKCDSFRSEWMSPDVSFYVPFVALTTALSAALRPQVRCCGGFLRFLPPFWLLSHVLTVSFGLEG